MSVRPSAGFWMCLAISSCMTMGCGAGPLVVSAAQSRGSEVKFGYTQAGSGNQGIISCETAQGGDLHSCRHMKIEFAD